MHLHNVFSLRPPRLPLVLLNTVPAGFSFKEFSWDPADRFPDEDRLPSHDPSVSCFTGQHCASLRQKRSGRLSLKEPGRFRVCIPPCLDFFSISARAQELPVFFDGGCVLTIFFCARRRISPTLSFVRLLIFFEVSPILFQLRICSFTV